MWSRGVPEQLAWGISSNVRHFKLPSFLCSEILYLQPFTSTTTIFKILPRKYPKKNILKFAYKFPCRHFSCTPIGIPEVRKNHVFGTYGYASGRRKLTIRVNQDGYKSTLQARRSDGRRRNRSGFRKFSTTAAEGPQRGEDCRKCEIRSENLRGRYGRQDH